MAKYRAGGSGLEDARKKAMRLLRVKLRSTAELRERLAAAGFGEGDIEVVVGELKRAKVLDDAALAEAEVRRMKERGVVGGGVLRVKLDKRGLSLGGGGEDAGSSRAEVLAFARKKLAAMPTALSEAARARRLFGLLARRGIDPERAMEIVERLTGVTGV